MSKYSDKVARRRQAAQVAPVPPPAPKPQPAPAAPQPLDMRQPERRHPYLPPVFIPVGARIAQLRHTFYNTYAKSLKQHEGYLQKKEAHNNRIRIIPELQQEVLAFEEEVRKLCPHWQHRPIEAPPPHAQYYVAALEEAPPPIDFDAIGKLRQLEQIRVMEEAITECYIRRKQAELEERRVQIRCWPTAVYVDGLKHRIRFARRVLRKEGSEE